MDIPSRGEPVSTTKNAAAHSRTAGEIMHRLMRLVEARRAELGLTQAQVAEAAGITERSFRAIKAHSHSCNLTTLVGLASALGVSLGELITGQGE